MSGAEIVFLLALAAWDAFLVGYIVGFGVAWRGAGKGAKL